MICIYILNVLICFICSKCIWFVNSFDDANFLIQFLCLHICVSLIFLIFSGSLMHSIKNNNMEIVKFLAERIPNGYSEVLINLLEYYSGDQNSDEFVKLFKHFALHPKCDINYKNNLILDAATHLNHIKIFKILLKDPPYYNNPSII